MKQTSVGYLKPSQNKVAAMKWWNGMNGHRRNDLCLFHFPGRKYQSLTGSEIAHIHANRPVLV